MPTQLRVVGDDLAGTPQVLASFRADARLRLWGAALCASLTIVFTLLGYPRTVPPIVAGPAAGAFLLWSAYLAASFAVHRSLSYRLTAQRLEIEQGVLGKRFESIELWRVRDVVLEQSLIERLRGVGRITLFSSDQVEPVLVVGPLADARPVFVLLRDAVAAARKEARVVPLDR